MLLSQSWVRYTRENQIGSVITIIVIVFGSITLITLGCVWMGTSYSAKKREFVRGATQHEWEQIQGNIPALKEQIADLIIIWKKFAGKSRT